MIFPRKLSLYALFLLLLVPGVGHGMSWFTKKTEVPIDPAKVAWQQVKAFAQKNPKLAASLLIAAGSYGAYSFWHWYTTESDQEPMTELDAARSMRTLIQEDIQTLTNVVNRVGVVIESRAKAPGLMYFFQGWKKEYIIPTMATYDRLFNTAMSKKDLDSLNKFSIYAKKVSRTLGTWCSK